MTMPKPPLSKTRLHGDTLYLSGELGFEADGSLPDGIEAQTRNCLERIKTTLEGAGRTMDDVLSCTCYLTNAADFAAFNAVYASYFADPLPTRTTVEAKLMLPGGLVEITAVAKA